MSASQTKALRSLVEPIAAAHSCDVEQVAIRRAGKRRLVRLVVEHVEGGLTLDLVAEISRAVSTALDISPILGETPYVLEVSSPGVDRPLRDPRHWDRAVGRLVRVATLHGEPVQGRVVSREQDEVVLDVEGGPLRLALADVARATVQVEFSHAGDEDREDDEDPGAGQSRASTPEEG